MISRAKGFSRQFVRSGDLIHRITLQRKALTPPATNGVDISQRFTDLTKVYAALRTTAPKMPFGSVNIDEASTHEFWIRYIAGIDKDVWILHEGQRYPILRAENKDSRNEWLVLYCNEKGASAIEASTW